MKMTILLAALAIVESGDLKHPMGNDHKPGKDGEISRYQIVHYVWTEYAKEGEHATIKSHATRIARKIIRDRVKNYQAHASMSNMAAEVIDPEIIYVLWHRPGQFMLRGYNLKRMPKTVQARCERFAAVCRDLEKKEGK